MTKYFATTPAAVYCVQCLLKHNTKDSMTAPPSYH